MLCKRHNSLLLTEPLPCSSFYEGNKRSQGENIRLTFSRCWAGCLGALLSIAAHRTNVYRAHIYFRIRLGDRESTVKNNQTLPPPPQECTAQDCREGSGVKSTCCFAEDPGLGLSTHVTTSNHRNSISRGYDALFWPPRVLHTRDAHEHIQTCTYT